VQVKGRTLIRRSLAYHWRSHLGVVLGAAVATAVLVGALAVGDSVNYSLLSSAESRLGDIQVAMISPNRFLYSDSLSGLGVEGNTHELILVRGIASRPDGTARINDCQVIGCYPPFFDLGMDWREKADRREAYEKLGDPTRPLPPTLPGSPKKESENGVIINDLVARDLGLKVGDEFILRMEKPGALPIDAPLADPSTAVVAERVTVDAIIDRKHLGNFSLAANQVPPRNIFIPKNRLAEQLAIPNQHNVIVGAAVEAPEMNLKPSLIDKIPFLGEWFSQTRHWVAYPVTVESADQALSRAFSPEAAGLHIDYTTKSLLAAPQTIEITSSRIFIDPPVAPAVLADEPTAVGILTYFVNNFKTGSHSTPYSMVAAVGPLSGKPEDVAAARKFSPLLSVLPADMKDDEIVLNQWLAEDLAAKPGDDIETSYYVMGEGNRLVTKSTKFRVRAVVPIEGAAADRDLMPKFPGIADVENCRDWHTGFPIDLEAIRDKDQVYWDNYRGTPKAFVTLNAGKKMWGNRFGDLTAIRISPPPNTRDVSDIKLALKKRLTPTDFGFYFQPVRERALAAATQSLDFGQLFLGLSMFLVIAALLLTGLLFGFGVQGRAAEIGTLLALGIRPRKVRRLMLTEGAILAAIGGVIGAAAGLAYTAVTLWALSTVWSGAVGGADLLFDAQPLTVFGGAAAGFVVALATIWLTVRRQARAPARELIAAGAEAELRLAVPRPVRQWIGPVLLIGCNLGAVGFLAGGMAMRGEAVAGMVFGAGTLFLIAGLGACHIVLSILSKGATGNMFASDESQSKSMRAGPLGLRGATRRRGRSLATIALLACGAFLVITVGANRKDSTFEAARRDSGTGGFALFGQTTVPVMRDLNTAEGRKAFGLPDNLKDKMKVVALRVHEGDDASCLNLNRPQRPRVIGVPVEALAERKAFAFSAAASATAGESPWRLLSVPLPDGSVPAVADQATLDWALKVALGDKIAYTDDRGQAFSLEPVAGIQASMLQGAVLISEEEFLRRFPDSGGFRMLLIDVTPGQEQEVSETLSRQLGDVGLALESASERLAEFNAVQNTYLAIFQALGGLALVLGSVGLGIVVLRNVLERRGELALLRAVGLRRRAIQWMVLSEHWALLAMGLGVGVVAGLGSALPLVTASGTEVPYLSLSITLAAVFVAGLVWTWAATRLALRGPLLEALRSE
jgi:putative ABC transport system permease protein